MDATWIVLGIILLLVIWFIALYNALIRTRNTVDESWSDIDTELKRRYDLIPNLIETVKGYAAHEKTTLNAVVEARNKAMATHGSLDDQAKDENLLTGTLRQLFALAESYPNLKANENFLQLQTQLSNTEDRIQTARRFYNANVRDLNNKIQVVPSSIIANMFNFKLREFFELEDPAMRQTPKVQF
jgi:LemA protein